MNNVDFIKDFDVFFSYLTREIKSPNLIDNHTKLAIGIKKANLHLSLPSNI